MNHISCLGIPKRILWMAGCLNIALVWVFTGKWVGVREDVASHWVLCRLSRQEEVYGKKAGWFPNHTALRAAGELSTITVTLLNFCSTGVTDSEETGKRLLCKVALS